MMGEKTVLQHSSHEFPPEAVGVAVDPLTDVLIFEGFLSTVREPRFCQSVTLQNKAQYLLFNN